MGGKNFWVAPTSDVFLGSTKRLMKLAESKKFSDCVSVNMIDYRCDWNSVKSR